MRVCEVIIFVCLFAKFFCEENETASTDFEICYQCPNLRNSNQPPCQLQRCSCEDSPSVRFKVDEKEYKRLLMNEDSEEKELNETESRVQPTRDIILLPPPPAPSSTSRPPGPPRPPGPLTLDTPRAHCIESEYMILVWNVSNTIPRHTYFYVRYHVFRGHGQTYETPLTSCNFMILSHLAANTTYRIELRSISIFPDGDGSPPVRGHSSFTRIMTRSVERKPEPVSSFYLARWILQPDRKYTAFVRWVKGADRTCLYNMVYFPSNGDYQEIDIDNPLVNDGYNITDLELGSFYPIAITPYTMSSYIPPLEGPKRWLNITTPSCLESYNQISACTPDPPQDLVVTEYHLRNNVKNLYNVIMEWQKPKYIPEFYTAHLKLIDSNYTEFFFNITGENTNVTFLSIPLTTEYEALLVAYSRRGPSRPTVIHRHVVANYTFIENDESIVSVEFILMITIPLIIIALIIMCLLNRFLTRKMKKQEHNKFFKNFDDKSSRPSTITTISTITFVDNLKADEWEIDTNKLAIKEILGGGAFGIVRKGWYTIENGPSIEVAIKMLRENPTHEEFKQFYQEIEIMKSVPLHPHLVSLIGCVTKQNLLLVVEFCSKGDLQTYLRNASEKMLKKANLMRQDSGYEKCKYVSNKMYDLNENDFEEIPQSKDLVSIARQVALGMEYLASLKVIHRDLAARNVLISEKNVAKISDFGLSRDVYYDNIYYKSSAGKLPIRWMALESMTHQVYTTQSDIWSFGILLWEIVTLGGTPYPGIQTQEVLGMLKGGYRMTKPDNCSEELYEIMCKCWKATPQERPTFTELRFALDSLLATFTNYLNLDTNNIYKNQECIVR